MKANLILMAVLIGALALVESGLGGPSTKTSKATPKIDPSSTTSTPRSSSTTPAIKLKTPTTSVGSSSKKSSTWSTLSRMAKTSFPTGSTTNPPKQPNLVGKPVHAEQETTMTQLSSEWTEESTSMGTEVSSSSMGTEVSSSSMGTEVSSSSIGTEEETSSTPIPDHGIPEQQLTETEETRELLELQKAITEQIHLLWEAFEQLKNATVRDLHTHCEVELTSVSASIPSSPETRKGQIIVNGSLATECNSQLTGPGAKPGVSVCVIDPTNCGFKNCQHFYTNDSISMDEGLFLKMYIENQMDLVTIAGVSCGESTAGLGEAKTMLKVLGADVDDVQRTGQYAFMVQTKKPEAGRIEKCEPKSEALSAKYSLTGIDSREYEFNKVDGPHKP